MTVSAVGKRFNPYRSFSRVSVIPNRLMSYPGVSSSAKLVWARLAQYAGKDGRAYPSVATLAADLGLKERQTQNLLAELRREGFIESRRGSGTNSYYFLLHPCLVDGLKQEIAVSDAKKCRSGVHDVAPKETMQKKQRRETTKRMGGRRVSFEDLSKEEQKYIDLKTAFEASKGNIHSSPSAYKAGLVKKGLEGELDISGLKELEVRKNNQARSTVSPGGAISSADKEKMRKSTIERVRRHVQEDERSPKELSSLVQEQGKERLPKGLWGMPYQSVLMGLKHLHPECW